MVAGTAWARIPDPGTPRRGSSTAIGRDRVHAYGVQGPNLDIPWENPTTNQQFDYYKDLLTNPLFLSVIAILIAFSRDVDGSGLRKRRDPARREVGCRRSWTIRRLVPSKRRYATPGRIAWD